MADTAKASDAGTIAAASETTQIRTHCRICEPQCGLIASVQDGRIVKIEPNKNHAHSHGHFCIKAAAAADIVTDPDRITTPMKRVGGPGEFEPVSWDEAMSDIVARLKAVRWEHGKESFATFMGNPPAFGYSTAFWLGGFQATMGVKWTYGVNGDDASSKLVANKFMYGSVATMLKPDLWRTNFVLMLGANPWVSHGSMFSEPAVREAFKSIVERGGRVVVVDPRRTETARQFEHLAVRPGADAFLLLGIARVLIEEGLTNRDYIAENVSGYEAFRTSIETFEIEDCAARCRIPAATIRQLARDFAAADGAIAYGRTGTCTTRFGTLTCFLIDAITVLTGNVGRKGGLLHGWGAVDVEKFAESSGYATFNKNPTRVNGHPDVFGMHPSTSLIPDITVPGPEQVHALMTIGCNPVLSSGAAGQKMRDALEQLDLHFSLDLYMNETNKHADYILPVTSFYERSDIPLAVASLMLKPSIWFSPAVVARAGQVRQEWEILQEICHRMGLGGAYVAKPMRWLAKLGIAIKPETLANLMLRLGPAGDLFGFRRGGLNMARLKQHPDGVRLKDELPVGNLREKLHTGDKKIALAPDFLVGDLERLRGHIDEAAYPMRLISMREMRSQNSWLHNSKRVMPASRKFAAFVNPTDADRIGLVEGGEIIIRSKKGQLRTPARISDDVGPGTVSMPYSWGHHGGWQAANQAGGVSFNELASGDYEDIEPIAGMSILNAIPIDIAAG